ncbi:hypothetical protein V6N11_037146 [Hibiscus sabdariffa]|uniref:Uncharacterized protein n=1 Tax=Hibiscus sabdariffa TaxID=183260 RepID=A0ABR2P0W3_9ROSI
MLLRKRRASVQVMVTEAHSENSTNIYHNAAPSLLQSTANNGGNVVIIGGNIDGNNSRVVESSLSTLALRDADDAKIDEDLHSWQLAVYAARL